MAGDTPTPLYDNKEGTRFENGTSFDLHKADKSLLPYDAIDERRRVDEALLATATQASELQSDRIEIVYPPKNPSEIAALSKQIMGARVYRMDPSETPFLRDEEAA